jgi:hypothetical protein
LGEDIVDWKNLVIDHLNHVYNQMCDTLDGVDPDLIVHADSGWRVQDIVGHLAVWYEERIETLRAWQEGQDYRIANYERDTYNQQAYEARKNVSFRKVAAEWQSAHEELIAILNEIPGEYFDRKIHYPWGETGTVAHLIERLIIHEREHQQEISEAQK